MKALKKLLLLLPAVAVPILELLPTGARLNFASPEGSPWVHTYSYFDLTPFGYANFGPFLTALLSCCLLILVAVNLFTDKSGIKIALEICSFLSLGTSLMPLIYGADCFTPIGIAISVLLAVELVISLLPTNDK